MNKAYHVAIFIVFAIFLFSSNLISQAQTKKQLTIVGKIAPEVKGTDTGTIEITKNGKEKSTVVIPIEGKYAIDLDFFNEYTLKFKYPGHIDKTIRVSTEIPDEIYQKNPNFPEFPLIVTLVKATDAKVKSEIGKPIPGIAYSKEFDNFIKLASPEK